MTRFVHSDPYNKGGKYFCGILSTFGVAETMVLFLQPIDERVYHQQVTLGKSLHFIKSFLEYRGIDVVFFEKIPGSHFEIITDGEKFGHAGQGPSAGYALHIGAAVSKLQAHAMFSNPFFQTQFCNPFGNVARIHIYHLICTIVSEQKIKNTRLKYGNILKYMI